MAHPIGPQATRDLGARALMDLKTVRRAYRDPRSVQPSTLARLVRAARSLGLPAPQLLDAPSGRTPGEFPDEEMERSHRPIGEGAEEPR